MSTATKATHTPRERRHTTAHDRYQITDPVCGLVETATSLKKALQLAKAHHCGNVAIFDVMARIDCAQVWDANGNITAFRKDDRQCPELKPTTKAKLSFEQRQEVERIITQTFDADDEDYLRTALYQLVESNIDRETNAGEMLEALELLIEQGAFPTEAYEKALAVIRKVRGGE